MYVTLSRIDRFHRSFLFVSYTDGSSFVKRPNCLLHGTQIKCFAFNSFMLLCSLIVVFEDLKFEYDRISALGFIVTDLPGIFIRTLEITSSR